MSREQLKGKRSLPKSLTKANNHSALYHVAYDLRVPGLSPREFLTQVAWKWRTRGRQLVAAYDNAELPAFPLRAEYVRGSSTAYFVYERLDTTGGVQQTRETLTTRVDVGGSVLSWFATKGSVRQLALISKMRKQFDKSREIDGATNGYSLLMMLVGSMVLQLLVVFAQNFLLLFLACITRYSTRQDRFENEA